MYSNIKDKQTNVIFMKKKVILYRGNQTNINISIENLILYQILYQKPILGQRNQVSK